MISVILALSGKRKVLVFESFEPFFDEYADTFSNPQIGSFLRNVNQFKLSTIELHTGQCGFSTYESASGIDLCVLLLVGDRERMMNKIQKTISLASNSAQFVFVPRNTPRFDLPTAVQDAEQIADWLGCDLTVEEELLVLRFSSTASDRA